MFELEAFGPDLTLGFVKTKMLREAVDPENLDENIMKEVKKDREESYFDYWYNRKMYGILINMFNSYKIT